MGMKQASAAVGSQTDGWNDWLAASACNASVSLSAPTWLAYYLTDRIAFPSPDLFDHLYPTTTESLGKSRLNQ